MLRWGGDLTPEEPVHIDDDLYNTQDLLYGAKLESRISSSAPAAAIG